MSLLYGMLGGMTQLEDDLAYAKDQTEKQRMKAQAALEVFAPKLGSALGKWVSDTLTQYLGKNPNLVAAIEDDAELTKIKQELNVILTTWPDKMKDRLQRPEIMDETTNRQFGPGLLDKIYASANNLMTEEALPFVSKAFRARPDFKLKRPQGFHFPSSIQHLVQASWEDFHAEQSKLVDLAKQQHAIERKLKERESTSRWEKA